MVKVQKPNPKTFKNNPKKVDKSKGIKKEKPTKDVKAISASNVTAKKAKTNLIEKEIQKNLFKPEQNVQKVKKPATSKKVVQQEEPKTKEADKKKGLKKEHAGVLLKKVETKPPTKKSAKAPGNDLQKQFNQVQKKKTAAGDKLQKTKATDKGKSQKKKNTVVDKAQVLVGQEQKKKTPAPQNKKKKSVPSIQFESQPFDEEQFNAVVNEENIKKIAQALKALVEKETNEMKTSIFSDFRYFLNVCCYKIVCCPKRIVKLNLEHSLVDVNEDGAVIIVPDLQRGAKVDYEPTIQHYEDLFREAGVTGLKIVPFNQVRNECTSFETKRKFVNTYDYFMCDGRIVGQVVGSFGKFSQKARTTFHAVRLNNPKTYKRDIDHALKRTSYKQLAKGDLVAIPVGNHRHTVDQLVENILLVVKQLKTLYPGGLGNIRHMHLKIDIKGTTALPLYANLGGAPADIPTVIGLREKRMLKLKKEANEVLAEFNLSKTGDFVKLDKAQAERKREIQKARKVLISDAPVEADEDEEVPSKKAKKQKGAEPEPEPESEDNEDVAGDEDASDDDEDDNDDDEEGDNDDEEDDNDVESADDDEDE